MYEQSYSFSFEAAHEMAAAPAADEAPAGAAHPYARLHGHSFVATVFLKTKTLEGDVWVADFAAVKRACAEVAARLDHHLLNDMEDLGPPSLERLSAWIFRQLKPGLPALFRVEVARPTLRERAAYSADE